MVGFQWFLTIFLLICPLFFFSQIKPCACSKQDRRARWYTWNTTFEQMNQGLLFHRGDGSATTLQPGSLGYYMRNSSALGFSSADPGWFVIPKWFDPWRTASRGGDQRTDLHQASFSIVLTLSAASTSSSSTLLFDILPRLEPSTSDSGGFSPRSFEPVKIEALDSTAFHSGRTIRVTTVLLPPENDDPDAAARRYSLRIEYDRAAHNLSVHLVRDDAAAVAEMPDETTLHLGADDTMFPDGLLFALSSTMGQLLQLRTWSFTIEVPETGRSRGVNTITVLSSVLGSAAAAAAIAAAVYLYLNSKYRRWRKELDQLAESMRRLPGVPMQVGFADIRKATGNFHEATRLGQGGFGAVYRCRLPAPNSKGEFVEVAVKKFTRADNRGYEDFLAEVSIINRLRHKNIVPLVGWSYNRGEPILIYEYMPNGSLDQQLFRKSSDEQQPAAASICRWSTRYNIVRDIATGLQYVHHEYEPMVLHRDIKASNILIDLTFQARLGDFGLACVLADGKNSYTDHGAPGTIGFRSPEYVYSGKATRKTDVFAFGVLVLEIVTGKRAVGTDVQFGHVTDWVWSLHAEGNLLAGVDAAVLAGEFDAEEEAVRLLQLGMACSNPNPAERPSMVDAVRVIGKSAPPPDVPPSKPPMVWPPEGWSSTTASDCSTWTSNFNRTSSTFMVETTGRERCISSGHSTQRLASPGWEISVVPVF
ncbi:L-type lectin-domain containing receptor kinase IX.1-like [Panicum miliaceum]|uniref:L-type lectin-domain containing receptor kinase IX.1-like n=1 Tax=Panicum miliaceum TaxID=4540 RepID=A0A3L6PM54_PANMI|nr:L-type lectin-domain containing receptor kinase IX.1-like [Panicum miliaceum]